MNHQSFPKRRGRHFLALVCAVVGWASAAGAQEFMGRGKNLAPAPDRQEFPPDHPAYRFDLPAGWTVDRGNNDRSMLVCSVRGRGDIGLVGMAVPQVFSIEDFAKILPGLAREQLEKQNLADLQIVTQGADQLNGCHYFFVITKGKLKDRSMSVTFIGLVSDEGRGYLFEYAVPSADGPARMKDFQAIMASLAPVR